MIIEPSDMGEQFLHVWPGKFCFKNSSQSMESIFKSQNFTAEQISDFVNEYSRQEMIP